MLNSEENEEDEVYFTPVSSTHLASLFHTTMVQPNINNDTSLTYKPPKQPSQNSATSENSSCKLLKPRHQSSVILFKEVHAFQLINKEYSPAGKCGLALIGNEQVSVYQLLIYKQKNNIISTTKITQLFEFIKQKNNYITIKDDKKLTWTIHFNIESDLNEFSNVISLKCGCTNVKPEEISAKPEIISVKSEEIKQEVIQQEQPAEPFVFQNDFKNPSKIEQEIKVDGTKISTETCSEAPMSKDQLENSSKNIDSDTSDSSGAIKKADILSRVAKMGKKILAQPSYEMSDSSDVEELCNNSQVKKVKEAERKHNQSNSDESSIQNNQIMQTATSANSILSFNKPLLQTSDQYLQLGPSLNKIMPYQDYHGTPQVVYSATQSSPDQFNMFFVENRTHNSEMRMNIIKLQNGLEQVINMIKKSDARTFETYTQTNCSCPDNIMTENKKLTKIVAENEKTISNLRNNYETCKKKNEDLMRKETEHSYEIASLTQETARCAYEEHKLTQKIKEQQAQLYNQASKLTECEEKLNKMNIAYADCVHIKKLKLPEIKETIKEQMNLFYNEATGIFKGDATYEGNHIKKILAPSIIDNTYKILNIINELFM